MPPSQEALNSLDEQPATRFCYKCGKRVGPEAKACYYCGAPVRPFVRPPKRCPFCNGVVSPKALKCIHCGEWMDGRKRAEDKQSAAQQGPNITFVIDKAIIGGDQPLRLQAGAQVPKLVADALPPDTVQAIESGQVDQIEHPGVKALLEGPSDKAGALEAEVVEDSEASTEPDMVGQNRALQRHEGGAVAARQPEAGKNKASAGGSALVRQAARGVGRWLKHQQHRRAQAREAAEREAAIIDAQIEPDQEESSFQTCQRCGTECRAEDLFCFHCGAPLTEAAQKAAEPPRPKPKALALLVAIALVLGAGMAAYYGRPMILRVVGGVGAVAALAAMIKGPGFVGRLLAVAILIAQAGLLFFYAL